MKLARAFHPLSLSHPPSVSASPFLSLSLSLYPALPVYPSCTYIYVSPCICSPSVIYFSVSRSVSVFLSTSVFPCLWRLDHRRVDPLPFLDLSVLLLIAFNFSVSSCFPPPTIKLPLYTYGSWGNSEILCYGEDSLYCSPGCTAVVFRMTLGETIEQNTAGVMLLRLKRSLKRRKLISGADCFFLCNFSR